MKVVLEYFLLIIVVFPNIKVVSGAINPPTTWYVGKNDKNLSVLSIGNNNTRFKMKYILKYYKMIFYCFYDF